MKISFIVYGEAAPGGSKRAFAYPSKDGKMHVRVTDANPKVKHWKQEVASAAIEAMGERTDLLSGPLEVTFIFSRPRPLGHFSKAGTLNAKGREVPFPISRPDVLKLARSVEDALTGIVYRDDAQIVSERLYKRWGSVARLQVTIKQYPYDVLRDGYSQQAWLEAIEDVGEERT